MNGIRINTSGKLFLFNNVRDNLDDTLNNLNREHSQKLILQHNYKFKKVSLVVMATDKGSAGNENKFELPYPIDKKHFFGDIFVVALDKNQNVIDLNKETFNELLTIQLFLGDIFGIASDKMITKIDVHKKTFNSLLDDSESLGSEYSWSSEEELSDTDSLNDFLDNE